MYIKYSVLTMLCENWSYYEYINIPNIPSYLESYL